jgi:hypothetical protein
MSLAARSMAAPWSAARIFLLIAAVVHIPLGIIGLLYDQTFPVGTAATERAGSTLLFGLLETNGWHSIAALGVGLAAAYFTAYPRHARDAALAIGLGHVGIVASLAIWDPSTFWLASNAADQVVHTATALGGTGAALLTTRTTQAAPQAG